VPVSTAAMADAEQGRPAADHAADPEVAHFLAVLVVIMPGVAEVFSGSWASTQYRFLLANV
jgi:hypothetical protein